MFLCTIFIWPCDLDLGGVWRLKSLIRPTHLPILSFLRLWIPELCATQSDHITITWNGQCTYTMSRDLSPGGGQKWSTFLKSLTPIYILCPFQKVTTKSKPCYMWKIAFIPLSRLRSSLHMRSFTWPVHRGSPKTTRNNFLTPTYIFTVQFLWSYDDD